MKEVVAVDWALIPEPDMIEFIIDLNQQLPDDKEQILLGNSANYPHVTVGMCFVSRKDIPSMKSELQALKSPSKTIYQRLFVKSTPEKRTSYYVIKPDEELLNYHMACLAVMNKYGVAGNVDSFYEKVLESTMTYVKGFHLYSGENYWPHMTLGYGQLSHDIPEFSSALRPGLFWLGNHCTCAFEI